MDSFWLCLGLSNHPIFIAKCKMLDIFAEKIYSISKNNCLSQRCLASSARPSSSLVLSSTTNQVPPTNNQALTTETWRRWPRSRWTTRRSTTPGTWPSAPSWLRRCLRDPKKLQNSLFAYIFSFKRLLRTPTPRYLPKCSAVVAIFEVCKFRLWYTQGLASITVLAAGICKGNQQTQSEWIFSEIISSLSEFLGRKTPRQLQRIIRWIIF